MKSERALGTAFPEGTVIYSQGEPADCMYVVQKGKVEIVTETEFGANRLVIKQKGDVFGEISLFACKSRFVTARALTDCIVLKVDEKTFVTKLHQDPSLAFRTIQAMAQRIYEQDHLLMRGYFHREERCCDVTGFASYIDLVAFLDHEVVRARRLMQAMAFAILDMDDFVPFCKIHGIKAGESLLKALAMILRENLQGTDVVGRFGKDRFGVLLYEADGMAALKVMNKVQRGFLDHLKEKGKGLEASFSCGISIHPEHEEAVALNKAAFKALTQAKAEGKNRIVVAEPGAKWLEKMAKRFEKADSSVVKKRPSWGLSFFS